MRSFPRNLLAVLVFALGLGSDVPPAGAEYLALYRSSMPFLEGLQGIDPEWGGGPDGVASADFNGDGYPDFAVANSYNGDASKQGNTISVLYHAGTQYLPSIDWWTPSTHGDLPPLDALFYNYTIAPPSVAWTHSCAAADLNGDSRPDLVVGTLGNGVALFMNTGASGVTGSQFAPVKLSPVAGGEVRIGDFDNNGVPEVVGTHGTGSNIGIQTFHVVADTLQPLAATTVPSDYPYVSAFSIGDVTGDGFQDVVLATPTSNDECAPYAIYVMTGYSAGAFATVLGPYPIGPTTTTANVLGFLIVASLDGDAASDVITVGSCTSALYIRLAHPGSLFDPMVTVPLPFQADKVCADDLDGDGDTDLVMAAAELQESALSRIARSVCVLKGNGDGTFAAPIVYGGLTAHGDIQLVDVNLDGRPDLVATQTGLSYVGDGHTLAVMLNDGSGGFLSGAGSAISQHSYRQVVADFNGDGLPDVASSGPNEVTIGFGNGTGTFTPGPSFPVTRPTTLVAGDTNRDGKVDLWVQSGDQFWDNTFHQYLGNGDGTFTFIMSYPGMIFPRSIADVTRDGLPDIVTSDGGQNVRIYVQNMFGLFPALVLFQSASSTPWDIAIGDWTRDGFPDIALATDIGIYAHPSTGLGSWGPVSAPLGGGRFKSVCVGDFNRDGYPDLAGRLDATGSTGPYGVQVFLNGPGGLQLGTLQTIQSTIEKRGFFLDTWDADIDGIPDLITSGTVNGGTRPTYNSADVLLGNGYGAFGLRTSYGIAGAIDMTALTLTTSGPYIAAGDVNRDGIPDLMTGAQSALDSSHVYTVLSSPPTHTAALHDAVFRSTLSGPRDVAVGDLNRDGKLDVVVATAAAAPGIAIHQGGGGGSIGTATSLAQSYNANRVRLADLNRDGILDIVSSNNEMGPFRVSSMLGVGNLTFGSRVDYFMNVGNDIEVGDMNRDGIPDVVVATADSVRVLFGNGTGAFVAAPGGGGVPLGAPIYDIDLADLNRDGVLDVVCAEGTVAVIYGGANGTLGAPVTLGISVTVCQDVCVADLDRDGFLDIVAHENSGCYVAKGEAALPFTSVFLSILPSVALDMKVGAMAANGLPYLVASRNADRLEVLSVGPFFALTSVGSYVVSSTTENLALADMDRDGLLDVISVGSGGSSVAINLRGTGTVTAVETSEAPAPRAVRLHQNYPNPFNPSTKIRFALPVAKKVRLTVHDTQGRLVVVLHDRTLPAGEHTVNWGGTNSQGHAVASGVYFYRIATEDGDVQSRRMVLVK